MADSRTPSVIDSGLSWGDDMFVGGRLGKLSAVEREAIEIGNCAGASDRGSGGPIGGAVKVYLATLPAVNTRRGYDAAAMNRLVRDFGADGDVAVLDRGMSRASPRRTLWRIVRTLPGSAIAARSRGTRRQV